MSEPLGTGSGAAAASAAVASTTTVSATTVSATVASERLTYYLEAFGERLRRALWLRAAAILALAALLLTLCGSWLAIRTGFGGGTLALVRCVLLLSLGVLSLVLLVIPLRRLRRERDRAVESLASEFDGRLRTFAGLPEVHPFKDLLAQDALGIAARHPPQSHIAAVRLALPAAVAAALVLALLWFAAAGPGLYRDGTRAIWAGWWFRNLLPAQRIEVDPGDQAVRRGANVTVRSRMQGFDPAAARLHARIGSGAWQQIEMARGARGFEFTLFSVREPVSYYVSAAALRSPTYELKVLDVPNVDRLRLVYHYPAWTQRPPMTQEGDGDISAIAGTRVDLQIHTDGPLAAGELVLDSAATPLTTNGNEADASIEVGHDGRYFVAARIGGERVRLTDDYLIKLLPLGRPEVRISWPGRDYSASSIEEVTTEVRASDEFGLQSLELHYSIDGGSWQSVALPVKGREASAQHVFMLESLRPGGQRPLAPGDLISYYATARDHAQSSQSDMYFIDVQPFDRRYSQASSGAGGGASGEQQEISQRQREILVSTWNLLRQKQDEGTSAANRGNAAIHDNAALLASLQSKLASQAQSLAGRAQARQLVAGDPRITRFIDSMKRAASAMQPAARDLAATDLPGAIAPEQQALQYLMRAASQFTDVQVAVQRRGSGAAGDSGRDLAQIYQLEMDLHKNQYESGNDASPESNDRQAEELERQLQSLARREQQLADQVQQAREPAAEQRWQQQSLQREAQDLRQRLNQLQQQQQQQQQQSGASASGNGATASNGAVSGNGTPESHGALGGSGAGVGGGAVVRGGAVGNDGAVLAGRLENAIRAMGQAEAAMRADGTDADGTDAAEQARQAVQEAQRSLAGAGTQLARERAQSMQQAIGQMADRADQLYVQQSAAEAQLQAAARGGAHRAAALNSAQQAQLTEQKRELSAGVQRLGDQIAAAVRQYRSDAPQTSAALAAAARVLGQADLRDRLDIAAEYLDQGQAAYIAPGERAVTQGLRELRDQLRLAAEAAGSAVVAATAPRDPLAAELARVRARREQLQRLADAAQTASGGGREAAMTAGLRKQITQLEQLELRLERREQHGEAIRTAVANPGADQYREAVAEYYRQLSRQ